jgi:O-acetylserine/cysteine efflux transporter
MTVRATLPLSDLVKVMVVTVVWGGNVIAVKYATADLPPFLVTALRFAAVGVLLCPFNRIPLALLKRLFPPAALLGVGHFGMLFLGLAGVDAASGSVFIQMGVPFSVLMAWAVFGDYPGPWRFLGLGLAMVGVALLAGAPGHASLLSIGYLLVSEICWALATLRIKVLAAEIPPLALNGWMAAMAAPLLFGLSWLVERDQMAAMAHARLEAWGGLLFTVLAASLIAYTLWYRLLSRHAIASVVPYTLLAPVFAFAAGSLMLGETITVLKVAGGLLTVAGIGIIEIWGPPSAPATIAAAEVPQ